MKKKLTIAAIAVGVAVAAAVYFMGGRSRDDGGNVFVSGTIEATTVELSFKVPGRVRERLVDEGESVKRGQVVARLEPEDLIHEVAARRAETQAASATLAELEAGYRKEEIAQAEAAFHRVSAEAERQRADFARQRELFRREVISRRDFETAKASFEGAQASEREAKERLAQLRNGPRRETIDQARARLRDSEALLALAETRLGYAVLASPLDGLVLSKNIEPGEQVTAGTPVITVGMLDEVWVRAYINETDLGKVKVGQEATVTNDTYPGKRYRGRVSFISSEAEFTPKNVQTAKERVKLVYRIKVVIPNPDRELKPGMPADVEIEINRAQGTRHETQG